jgi:hypothetical protein
MAQTSSDKRMAPISGQLNCQKINENRPKSMERWKAQNRARGGISEAILWTNGVL